MLTRLSTVKSLSPLAAPKSDEGGRWGEGQGEGFVQIRTGPMRMKALAKKLPRLFDTHMAAGESTQPKPWTFRPDIGPSNIKAKLPENPSNILLSGRTALLMI